MRKRPHQRMPTTLYHLCCHGPKENQTISASTISTEDRSMFWCTVNLRNNIQHKIGVTLKILLAQSVPTLPPELLPAVPAPGAPPCATAHFPSCLNKHRGCGRGGTTIPRHNEGHTGHRPTPSLLNAAQRVVCVCVCVVVCVVLGIG